MSHATHKNILGQPAPDFHLPATNGDEYTLASFANKKALVIMFTCNHCPYVQAYEERLKQVQADYAPQGVQLVAINANDADSYPEDNFENMVRRAAKRGFNFPYLHDRTQRTARAYGAEYTPEVFALDAERRVRYIGRIDDNWQHPEQARSQDLRAALDALLAAKAVPNPVTHAIGCTIKWKI